MSTLANPAQTRHPSGMDPLPRAESTNPFSLSTSSVDKEEAREIPVHNLKAKFFFDRPAEDLIPARYLRMAQDSPLVHGKPWIFRNPVQDFRHVNLKAWSKTDLRYQAVFKALRHVPKIETGLWDGGTEDCERELIENDSRAQAQVVYALLNDIDSGMGLKKLTADAKRVFSLKARLLIYQMEYWTGYREKHKDGPETDAVIALEFDPGRDNVIPILPIAVTNYQEPLEDALANKFKLILAQLLQHVRPLPVPGDKIPDQETFLIGQHGSKLHIMRAFFPGHKLSSLWCRRELPYKASPIPPMHPASRPSPSPSPPDGSAAHIEHSSENDAPHVRTASTTDATRNRSNSNRFYTPENIERVQQHIDSTKLSMRDNEMDTRTFRVLCTREYDLWKEKDFADAVNVLVALQLYLLSGSARCGPLQAVFNKPPYPPDDPGTQQSADENEVDEEEDEFDLESDDVESLRDKLMQQLEVLQSAWRQRNAEWAEQEEKAQGGAMDTPGEEYGAPRHLEVLQEQRVQRTRSARELRRSWWDFVWEDLEGERLERIEGLEVSDDEEEELAEDEGEGEDISRSEITMCIRD
ncbi:hypothetical protein PMG11_01614 [Penicillium brasilianum]|uniref:Uncharacterized protein n=1 Tax=Penicillium brasilianum TaxID=104259 RepID=A0A0F7TIM3_PENBI|nr:hypothetical protein PMG11_01614 [Penicillium brasilianum]